MKFVTKLLRRMLWHFDMAIYRVFQWRWNKRLRESPELAALFAEWSVRFSRAHKPVAAEVQIKINSMLDNYEVDWRAQHLGGK